MSDILKQFEAGMDPEKRAAVFARFGKRPSFSFAERFVRTVLRSLAYMTMFVTFSIVGILLWNAMSFFAFEEISVLDFLLGTKWEPFGEPKHFGIWPLLGGTLMIAVGSAVVAIPLGLGSAIYLTQYADTRVREIFSPILEVLGGIPTVVYGFFAVTVVTPFLQNIFPAIKGYNALSASIVVGVMILPMISSLSTDALRAVPTAIQSAGYALGMRKFHVVVRIVIPAATSGIVASFILAFARAVGETMAVTLAAGLKPNLTLNYLDSIQTMTAYIVQVTKGETPVGTLRYYSVYAVGLMLFCFTFAFNYLAARIVRRYREVYQ